MASMRLILLVLAGTHVVLTQVLPGQDLPPRRGTALELPSGSTVELLEARLLSFAEQREGQIRFVTSVPPGDSAGELLEAWQVVALAAAQLDSLGQEPIPVVFVTAARRDATGRLTLSQREFAFLRDASGWWRPHRYPSSEGRTP